ncbi:MAG TPA: hypothetical protein VFY57_02360, partial [Rubrobacteraceae bacterium]|nr:hypothetical protein [Rubrobacteraceae bacterium]
VELMLVGEQPLAQLGNHVLVKSRFGSQPFDERAQIPLAAAMLLRLNSEVGELTARLRRLVAESRDLEIMLTGLSAKPSELPIGCGPVLGHRPKGTKRPPPAPEKPLQQSTNSCVRFVV